jgi:hypothetical protein
MEEKEKGSATTEDTIKRFAVIFFKELPFEQVNVRNGGQALTKSKDTTRQLDRELLRREMFTSNLDLSPFRYT